MSHATEAFTKAILLVEYGDDDPGKSRHRLYFSALELLFMRASLEELRAVLAYVVGDTRELGPFDPKNWAFRAHGPAARRG